MWRWVECWWSKHSAKNKRCLHEVMNDCGFFSEASPSIVAKSTMRNQPSFQRSVQKGNVYLWDTKRWRTTVLHVHVQMGKLSSLLNIVCLLVMRRGRTANSFCKKCAEGRNVLIISHQSTAGTKKEPSMNFLVLSATWSGSKALRDLPCPQHLPLQVYAAAIQTKREKQYKCPPPPRTVNTIICKHLSRSQC